MVINPHVFANVPFDTLKDFAPVGKIGDATLILVAQPGVSGEDTAGADRRLEEGAQGRCPTARRASAARRTSPASCSKQRTGAKLVHMPYKGGGQAMTDVLGGNDPAGVHCGRRRACRT